MSKADAGCAYTGVALIVMFNLAFWGLVIWGLIELILLISRS